MKKLIIVLIFSLTLCGCAATNDRNDIENTTLVRVFGIDKSNDMYTVTILHSLPTSGDEKKYATVSGDGNTVYEAYEEVKRKNDKYATLSQTKFFIIGADAAMGGIRNCVDFAIRHEAVKTDAQVLITAKSTAKKVLDSSKESDTFLADTLESIKSKEEKTVKHVDSSLDAMQKHFMSNESAFLVSNLADDETVYIDGYCVFSDGKLVDAVDLKVASGIDFVLGNIKSGPVIVGNQFGALITDIKTKRSASIENNSVKFILKTTLSTAIREVVSPELTANTSELEAMQNDYINKTIDKAIGYVKETGYDIIGVKETIKAKNPKEWKNIEATFKVSDVDFQVETSSKITKTFDLEITEAS